MQAVYDAQIYYLDQGLGQLVQALKNLGLLDRSLIVVFSDHGQAFGEHGKYASHAQVYDELTQIVFIVRDPRLSRRGAVVEQVVQAVQDTSNLKLTTGIYSFDKNGDPTSATMAFYELKGSPADWVFSKQFSVGK